MGFLKTFFGKNSNEGVEGAKIPWVSLVNVDTLDTIEEKSHEKPQLIFKHSTTCGISRMVFSMFNETYDFTNEFDVYYLDLHAYREISNKVAEKFRVMHQSPQLLVIKNGQVAHHTSHGTIVDVNLNDFI